MNLGVKSLPIPSPPSDSSATYVPYCSCLSPRQCHRCYHTRASPAVSRRRPEESAVAVVKHTSSLLLLLSGICYVVTISTPPLSLIAFRHMRLWSPPLSSIARRLRSTVTPLYVLLLPMMLTLPLSYVAFALNNLCVATFPRPFGEHAANVTDPTRPRCRSCSSTAHNLTSSTMPTPALSYLRIPCNSAN